MKFDEMNVEQLEARQAELAGMPTDDVSTDELEARADELEAIQAELMAREEAAKALVERLGASSRDVMLVFFGKDVPQEEAESLVADLQSQYKNLEIMLNNGAQPVYDYIFVLC